MSSISLFDFLVFLKNTGLDHDCLFRLHITRWPNVYNKKRGRDTSSAWIRERPPPRLLVLSVIHVRVVHERLELRLAGMPGRCANPCRPEVTTRPCLRSLRASPCHTSSTLCPACTLRCSADATCLSRRMEDKRGREREGEIKRQRGNEKKRKATTSESTFRFQCRVRDDVIQRYRCHFFLPPLRLLILLWFSE